MSLRILRRGRPPLPPPLRPLSDGLTVVIPEQAGAGLLADCLLSAKDACRSLREPWEIIVVVNGSPFSDYRALEVLHPEVRWFFHRDSRAYRGAIRAGLREARYDWVYLLHHDKVLEPDALAEALRWRSPTTFAVSSRILSRDSARQCAETGWTDLRSQGGMVDVFHRTPSDEVTVRGSLFAPGGSSLFQAELLRRLMGTRDRYAPSSWEDVEWGVRACLLGYQVLFCPTSRAWQNHRAAVLRTHRKEGSQWFFERDRLQFHLRNLDRLVSLRSLFHELRYLHRRSLLELLHPDSLLGVAASRIWLARSPFDDSVLPTSNSSQHLRPLGPRPRLLVVSPYALLPPKHGGALRTQRLLREVARSHDIVLVSDEPDSYLAAGPRDLEILSSLHPVGGRIEKGPDAASRVARIRSHSHAGLRQMVWRRLYCDRPSVVQVEFVELAALVEGGKGGVPWCLHLQDVLVDGENPAADSMERRLSALHDAVITCSQEDSALLPHRSNLVLPACADGGLTYRPSPGNGRILFMGPFRYRHNLDGIQRFLELVWPRLLAGFPQAKLEILGGDEGPALAQALPCFSQPGVRVRDRFEQPRALLEECDLSISPLPEMRGSSLKVIESIANGRVCVATEASARGFRSAGFPSLVTAPGIGDLFEPILRLLLDEAERHAREKPVPELLRPFTWSRAGKVLADHHLALGRAPSQRRRSRGERWRSW